MANRLAKHVKRDRRKLIADTFERTDRTTRSGCEPDPSQIWNGIDKRDFGDRVFMLGDQLGEVDRTFLESFIKGNDNFRRRH